MHSCMHTVVKTKNKNNQAWVRRFKVMENLGKLVGYLPYNLWLWPLRIAKYGVQLCPNVNRRETSPASPNGAFKCLE